MGGKGLTGVLFNIYFWSSSVIQHTRFRVRGHSPYVHLQGPTDSARELAALALVGEVAATAASKGTATDDFPGATLVTFGEPTGTISGHKSNKGKLGLLKDMRPAEVQCDHTSNVKRSVDTAVASSTSFAIAIAADKPPSNASLLFHLQPAVALCSMPICLGHTHARAGQAGFVFLDPIRFSGLG